MGSEYGIVTVLRRGFPREVMSVLPKFFKIIFIAECNTRNKVLHVKNSL